MRLTSTRQQRNHTPIKKIPYRTLFKDNRSNYQKTANNAIFFYNNNVSNIYDL